jgi:transposase-like protein
VAQHFLVSAKSRTLSVRDVRAMDEEAAYETFCKLRWPGGINCPRCGSLDYYKITRGRRLKCADCAHQYSATSGTIFAHRKMTYRDLLTGLCLFANAVKGVSSLQFARDMGCNAKTAFVMLHKLREAVGAETQNIKLSGDVEIDGAFFGGHIRPANLKENRIDRRFAEHQTGKRRVVVALRERKGRTVSFVATSEAHGVVIAARMVKKGSTMIADEAAHWDALHAAFETQRINHSVAYSLDGIHTNFVESYFSRLRRMIQGQHHFVSARHLAQYASEAAWKEDHRRLDNGAIAHRALGLALAHTPSKFFAGYWHRTKEANHAARV